MKYRYCFYPTTMRSACLTISAMPVNWLIQDRGIPRAGDASFCMRTASCAAVSAPSISERPQLSPPARILASAASRKPLALRCKGLRNVRAQHKSLIRPVASVTPPVGISGISGKPIEPGSDGIFLYQEVLRVPFLVTGPEGSHRHFQQDDQAALGEHRAQALIVPLTPRGIRIRPGGPLRK